MERLLLFALLASLTGCGAGAKVEPVSGTVTLNGKPLPNAVVRFMPKPQEDPQAVKMLAMGETDDQGRYTLQVFDGPAGAVVGVNRVTISTAKSIDDGTEEGARTPEKVPPKYNSQTTLEFEVPAGGTDSANFDLEG